MSNLEFIWRRWAESKAGMTLTAVVPIRIPVKTCRVETILYVANEYPLLNEYTLRCVSEGFVSLQAISRFLGLENELIAEAIAEEISSSNIYMTDDGTLSLTSSGAVKLLDLKSYETRPFKFEVDVDMIDGAHYPQGISLSDKDMSSDLERLGFENEDVKPLPKRFLDKVDRTLFTPGELNALLDSKTSKVLEIKRAYKLSGANADKFRLAYALVYADFSMTRTELEFLVDGEFSEAYRREFLADAPEELLNIKLESSPPQPLVSEIVRAVAGQTPELSSSISSEIAKLPILDIYPENGPTPSPVPRIGIGQFCSNEMIPGQLSVFEHPNLLHEALLYAKNRLVIFSPWITTAVVNASFMANLSNCLKRGVVVYIVYGFGDNSKTPTECINRLCELASRFDNFSFRRHDNSHAKTFIVDNLVVVTSFNWLSFRGDARRTYRNEEGMQFTGASFADRWYEGFLDQMNRETVPACPSRVQS